MTNPRELRRFYSSKILSLLTQLSRHSQLVANCYRIVLAVFIATICIYVYARSPLRERLENRLFDVRVHLAPTQIKSDKLAIISIGEDDIRNIHKSLLLSPSHDLHPEALITILRSLQISEAKTIAVLLHAQVYALDTNFAAELVTLAQADRRVILGIGYQGRKDTVLRALPKSMRQIASQLGSYEASRSFRRDVVRDMLVATPQNFPYLIERLSEQLGLAASFSQLPVDPNGNRRLRINYFDPEKILTIRARDLLADNQQKLLKGRTVLVGYTAFRPWTLSTLDATHLNSPWQNDGADVDASSMPLVVLQAEALLNLQQSAWLRSVPKVFSWIFLVSVVLLTCVFWRRSVGLACILFIGLWVVILGLSALGSAWLHVYLPLADALIASTLAMIVAAALRLRQIAKLHASTAAAAASRAEVRRIQQRFLDRLSYELTNINSSIQKLISDPLPIDTPSALVDAHRRLQMSASEFGEYLRGMDQLRLLENEAPIVAQLKPIFLQPVIEAVITTLTLPSEEPNRIQLSCSPDLMVVSDDYLLSQILYNLLSNALKYSPPTCPVHITANSLGTQIIIHVTDQGPGIAKEYQEHIFEKYYRINEERSTPVKGHGLGLYLSRFFAKHIDAQLSLQSTLGQGTTFELRLASPNQARVGT